MAVTIDNIPVYQALVDDEDTGMFRISLVDSPAVMSDFQAFDSQKRPVMYRISDEEKRLVRGVVMRADFPIYRYDKKAGEYYIIYKAETIRTMAEKYLLESRQNDVNLMHEEGSDVDGVQMVQYFIKDTAAGVSPAGFDDIADGSLFAEFHVVNGEVWDAIREGTYKGFSLEGVFNLVPETDKDDVQRIVDELDGKFNNQKNKGIMGKMQNLKKAILALLEENFANVTTDKGVLSWDGDEDLKAGDNVYTEDAEGNRTPAADGDYKTGDGKTIKVADGKVTEIVDPEAEVDSNFGRKDTDKGELLWDGEEDLQAGDSVYVERDGERVAAPDGDYRTEDGKVIRVADGKVSEIVDDSAEVAGSASERMRLMKQAFSMSYNERYRKIYEALSASGKAGYDFYIVDASDDFAVIESWDRDYNSKYFRFSISWNGDEVVVGDSIEVKYAFIPVDQEVVFKSERDALKAEVETLRAEVERLKKEPAARPAHEVFNGGGEPVKTGNKGIDRLARYMASGRE